MKLKIACLGLALLSSGPALNAAEASSGTKPANTGEIETLRKLLELQKKYPDKVIRHPDEVITAQAVPPPRPAQPTPPAASPPPSPAQPRVTPPPAARPAPAAASPEYTVPESFPTYQELEDAYLSRKISARRFEEALKLLEKHKKIDQERKAAVNKILQERGIQPPGSPEQQKKIAEAEGKVDELMRQKALREKSATNAPPTAGPLTKRQRLDALLRQLIDGKITDVEYREKREKIIAEPD